MWELQFLMDDPVCNGSGGVMHRSHIDQGLSNSSHNPAVLWQRTLQPTSEGLWKQPEVTFTNLEVSWKWLSGWFWKPSEAFQSRDNRPAMTGGRAQSRTHQIVMTHQVDCEPQFEKPWQRWYEPRVLQRPYCGSKLGVCLLVLIISTFTTLPFLTLSFMSCLINVYHHQRRRF